MIWLDKKQQHWVKCLYLYLEFLIILWNFILFRNASCCFFCIGIAMCSFEVLILMRNEMSGTRLIAWSSPDYSWQSCSAAVWLLLISVIPPAAHHCPLMWLANSAKRGAGFTHIQSQSDHWDMTQRLRGKTSLKWCLVINRTTQCVTMHS